MSVDDKRYWLDERRNVNKIIYALCAVCAGFLAADLFSYKHHLHFGFEHWYGFYGIFGFVACVGLVLAAKVLRLVVKRDEDYYD